MIHDGMFWRLLFSLLGLAGIGISFFVGRWINSLASKNVYLRWLNTLWTLSSTAASHANTRLKPLIDQVTADGVVTEEELAQLKAEAIKLVKEELGQMGMNSAKRALGAFGGSLESIIGGFVADALRNRLPAALTPATPVGVLPAVSSTLHP